MAFSVTYAASGDNKLDVYGATDVAIFTLTFSGADTYVTGGLALAAVTFGLSRPILAVEVIAQSAVGFGWVWIPATGKLMAYAGNVTGTYAANLSFSEASSGNTGIQSLVLTVRVTTQR